jgi:hypothetical protein
MSLICKHFPNHTRKRTVGHVFTRENVVMEVWAWLVVSIEG